MLLKVLNINCCLLPIIIVIIDKFRYIAYILGLLFERFWPLGKFERSRFLWTTLLVRFDKPSLIFLTVRSYVSVSKTFPPYAEKGFSCPVLFWKEALPSFQYLMVCMEFHLICTLKIGSEMKKKPTFWNKPWPKLVKISYFLEQRWVNPSINYPSLIVPQKNLKI